MSQKPPAPLRNHGHRVSVVRIDGQSRPVLGTAHPDDTAARLKVLTQWGQATAGPRAERLAAIDEPLPQRSQTILSYQVGPELRARLNGGVGSLAGSRREQPQSEALRLPLGDNGHPSEPD